MPYLNRDVRSIFTPDKIRGKKGDEVTVIVKQEKLWAVDLKGDKFWIDAEAISNTPPELNDVGGEPKPKQQPPERKGRAREKKVNNNNTTLF